MALPGSRLRIHLVCGGGDAHQWSGMPCLRKPPRSAGSSLQETDRPIATDGCGGPGAAEELRPDRVVRGSNDKPYWRCRHCLHKWEATIYDRAISGTGCPRCARNRAAQLRSLPLPGESFREVQPELAAQWFWGYGEPGLDPEHVRPSSNKSPLWQCPDCGHLWRARVSARTRGGNCPRCVRAYSSTVEQQIGQELRERGGWPTDPIGRLEVDGRRPYHCDIVVTAWRLIVEYDGWYWHRSTESRTTDGEKTRRLGQAGWTVIRIREALHPITANDVVVEKLRSADLVSVVEKVIATAAELGIPVPVSAEEYRLRGADGPLPFSTVGARRPHHGRALPDVRPELVGQWHPDRNGALTPDRVYAFSGRRVWWRCDRGHEWEAPVARRSSGSGCLRCIQAQSRSRPGADECDGHVAG